MAAIGPDFKSGYADLAPISNADVATTLAHILGFNIPSNGDLTGRVITEALKGGPDSVPITTGILKSDPAENGQQTYLNYQQVGDTKYFDAAGFEGRTVGLSTSLQTDDILFSFAVIGCNREDKADLSPDNPSTANLEQLNRTFQEIAQLSPNPKFLFFAGDLVYGYTPDTTQLESELKAWLEVYNNSPLASSATTLIPIPGNHEVQDDKKVAYEEAEKTWLSVMAPYLQYAGNGPQAGGPDNLKTDQSSLTYSFDYLGTHFVLLDTDPVGKDWSVPVQWVEQDLDQAQANQDQHIFAIGHKPAYAYPTDLYSPPLSVEDGLGKLYPEMRDEFWNSLNAHHVEAMLAAHDHLYYRAQPNGQTWQIIAGNGGSPLESVVNQQDMNYYGFTIVNVLKDGHVTVTSYGRDVPDEGYLASSAAYPTTIRDQADITWTN